MGRFHGFYKGDDDTIDTNIISEIELFFAKRRQNKDNPTVRERRLNIYKRELNRCSSLSDYQNYVKKYDNPDNPFVSEAKQKIDDLTFANCKTVADYNNYLSSFPSGRHFMEATFAAMGLQFDEISTNTSGSDTPSSHTSGSHAPSSHTSGSHTPSSHNSDMSGEDVWRFVKKVIGVIVILPLLALIYLWITDEASWFLVGAYGLFIVSPVCKWAFDI